MPPVGLAQRDLQEPWKWDHPWTLELLDDQNTRAVGSLFVLLFFVPGLLFMNIMFIWGFVIGETSLPTFLLQSATILFIDACLAQMLLLPASRHILRRLRIKRTRLRLPWIPLALGTRVPLEWVGPPAAAKLPSVTVTLRRIEERIMTTGRGKDRRIRIVRDLKYERSQRVETGTLRDTGRLSFSLDLPPPAPGLTTVLSPPRHFWELHLTAKPRSGGDLDVTFLLPVYEVREALPVPQNAKAR
ncbi:hypothetical protein MFUL124B02_19685 [Myxococcus fulvus 124B02]|nr:hypothetical protein MFUL124B02_19685 [Myxococcus fulvus 124B02]